MINITQKRVRGTLAKFIRKISVFESTDLINYKHRLIPSGSTYLSYNHKDIPTYIHKKRVQPSQRLQITGPKTQQDICVEYGGDLLQILIEFTPTGFYYIFHDSPVRYLNELVDLSQFVPYETIENLTGQLFETDDADMQIDILQDYLAELSFHSLPFCTYIEEAIAIINKSIGKTLVKDIAKEVNISERQFNRQFFKMVGVSPKIYSKILQLHYIINLMNLKEFSSFKEISYSCNFFDQSHFNHRFKDLIGLTPYEFLISKEHNALKYFTDIVKTR